jgi:hypothetical protein
MHGVDASRSTAIGHDLDAAEQLSGKPQKAALAKLASQLDHDASGAADPVRVRAMAATVKALANA